MLYKVTPMLAPPEAKKPREPGAPRKKRKSSVYDHEGHEVLITLMCLKCKNIKPLMQFGLRKMADGAIRNQPWCRTCRSGVGTKPKKEEGESPVAQMAAQSPAHAPSASPDEPLVAAAPEPAPAI